MTRCFLPFEALRPFFTAYLPDCLSADLPICLPAHLPDQPPAFVGQENRLHGS
jgi:hypothetical protein